MRAGEGRLRHLHPAPTPITVIDSEKITVADTITYDSESNTHDDDQTVATNQFD